MSINVTAVMDKVRKLQRSQVKILHNSNDDKVSISINEGSGWVTVIDNISKKIADDIVGDNSNQRVILG